MHGPRGARRFSVSSEREAPPPLRGTSEDLHAWSIYRQNLNSDFTDSALGSADKSPLPYGNFQLRESTMASILNNPKYGPRSELGTNMYTYLKFGLPRVLPPGKEEGLENSSGYDSTDEEVMGRRQGGGGRGRLRAARSEDFLNRTDLGGREAAGLRYSSRDNLQRARRGQPGRSASEANLLAAEAYYDGKNYDHRSIEQLRREAGLARSSRGGETGYLNAALEEERDVPSRQQRSGLRSRAASQLSVVSRASKHSKHNSKEVGAEPLTYRHDAPMLNNKYFPKDGYGSLGNVVEAEELEGFKYPHLQLKNLCYSVKQASCLGGQREERLLDMINIEARGGELVAVLATKSKEGTALCQILANRHRGIGKRLRGDILINGINVDPSRLADRVALVERDISFTPDMSVRQTLLFHSLMREPGTLTRGRDTKGRINALIEDLGLSQVKHTRVADLTVSEKQRLNVACHLLLDTDIVLLDQPTEGMDIFDTFFLVEYLRQWAARGRIVILTMHPPTYEIFTMISKVVLLSCGRLMYFGKRREMLPYFAFIEYPCPAYKNPSDYYLDLVTLDDLSPEAMLESSQRVEQLSSIYQRKCEPLSDPGPPGIMPPKIKRANLLMQVFGLWIRAMIYTYPFNVIQWVKLVLLAGVMSTCLGGVFVGIRWRYWDTKWQQDHSYGQENVNDRLGFHHVIMSVGLWPILLSTASEVWRSKPAVTRDVEDRLYSRFSYALTKTLYSVPASIGVGVAYCVPAYLLAGLHYPDIGDLTSFYLYIGYMLLYLACLRALTICLATVSSSRHRAAFGLGFVVFCTSIVSGYLIHQDDLADWVSWLRYPSPQYWTSHPILERELGPVGTLLCHFNPMITDTAVGRDILRKVKCGLEDGKAALRYFSFLKPSIAIPSVITSAMEESFDSDLLPIVVLPLLLLLLTIGSILLFVICRQHQGRKRSLRNAR